MRTELADGVEQLATVTTQIEGPDGAHLERTQTEIALVSKRDFELRFRCSPVET